MNTALFATTLRIPSYDIGKNVGLRTYQQPLVHKAGHVLVTPKPVRLTIVAVQKQWVLHIISVYL